MGWLELFHEKYHWTEKELLNSDLLYVLGLLVVKAKLEAAPKLTPIDQVGLF